MTCQLRAGLQDGGRPHSGAGAPAAISWFNLARRLPLTSRATRQTSERDRLRGQMSLAILTMVRGRRTSGSIPRSFLFLRFIHLETLLVTKSSDRVLLNSIARLKRSLE